MKDFNYYMSLGYEIEDIGRSIVVDVSDVPKYSTKKVQVECDYCHKVFERTLGNHTRRHDSNTIDKDSCNNSKCRQEKIAESKRSKSELNLLKEGDFGYWSIKKNRMNKVKEYIEKNGNIDYICSTKEGKEIVNILYNYNEDIETIALELGYGMDDIRTVEKFKYKYFYDFENVEKEISIFIDEYDRFPTYNELLHKIKMHVHAIAYHGGIEEIKKNIKKDFKGELRDDSGYFNKSSYEYMVAQFLIANKIPYKREQHPFPKTEGQHRSDFTLYQIDGNEIHIEVWGYSKYEKTDKSSRVQNYKSNKTKKENLYKRYNISLISIYPDLFNKNTYTKIQEELKLLFESKINTRLAIVENNIIIPNNKKSDSQLFNEVMKLSDNPKVLPSTRIIQKYSNEIYKEILKRFGNIKGFANEFNVVNYNKKNKVMTV